MIGGRGNEFEGISFGAAPARPDTAAGSGVQEAATAQNPMETFLEGHPRGTPRYKAAADLVALRAAVVELEGKSTVHSPTGRTLEMRRVAITERIEGRKAEEDGEAYERALKDFSKKVIGRYASEVRAAKGVRHHSVDKIVADRMLADWKEATQLREPVAKTAHPVDPLFPTRRSIRWSIRGRHK